MVTTSKTGLCNSESGPEYGEDTDERNENVPEADLLLSEHVTQNRSVSSGQILDSTDDNSYYVSWTFYIALAVPRDADAAEAPEHKRRSSMKGYKAQSCYHIEYKLPGDTKTVNVDLIMFGPVAKLYKEDEFKILRTWHDGDQTWIGWTQSFNVRVNRDMLINQVPHEKIKFQIWNSRNKLSSFARYEQQKPLKLQQNQLEDATENAIESKINEMRALCEKMPKKKIKHYSSDGGSERAFQKPAFDEFELKNMKKISTASVEIHPICFLAGEISLTEHFPVCSAGVLEIMCNISLDRPLLCEQLRDELNPLVITILSATSLPSAPLNVNVQEKCMPVYCQYKFNNKIVHRTSGHKHSEYIYFRDVNVILAGSMCPEELKETLSGPLMEIEVHDRDEKLQKREKSPTMFGSGPDNDNLHSEVQSRHKRVSYSYGIARLNLSELLLQEKKSLKMTLPIYSCLSPSRRITERSSWNNKISDQATRKQSIPQAQYFDSNSQLKVKVEIARPINTKKVSSNSDGPFGRIIYFLDCKNVSVMTRLRSEILRINASAFNLNSRSPENTEIAISNYTMNFKPDESRNLDYVTGFHVVDKKTHIFVLEGLKQKAVKRLWEAVPVKLSGRKEEQVIVLYNSSLAFFKRIYNSLHKGLIPIYLSESLEAIVKQPLVYIRGVIPKACLHALSRLSQLCQARQLKDVVQSNLFPSADMILSMMEKYGTEPQEQQADAVADVDAPCLRIRMKRHASLDMLNTEYMNHLQFKQVKQCKDYVKDNIYQVIEDSQQIKKPPPSVIRIEQSADKPVYNYSTQTLNAKEQAMELLRKEMAKFPGRRFTYSQQFHSATVEIGDVTTKKDSKSRATPKDWSISGIKPQVNPNLPDEARVEELKKPWSENILHANVLKPTLTREIWPSWKHRDDFQLYFKPPTFFNPTPVSVHLADQLDRCSDGIHPRESSCQHSVSREILYPIAI